MSGVSIDGLSFRKVEGSGKYPAYLIDHAASVTNDVAFGKFLTYLQSKKCKLDFISIRQVVTKTAPGQAYQQSLEDPRKGHIALSSGLDLIAGRMVPMGDPIVPVIVIDASRDVYDQ